MKKFTYALLVAFLGFAIQTKASVMINVTQVGGDVVFSTSGSLDLTGANLYTSNGPAFGLGYISGFANWYIGQGSGTNYDAYSLTSFDGPFGTSGAYNSTPSWSIGDNFFIWGNGGSNPAQVGVKHGYVSGSAISAEMGFFGATFASLNLTEGVYSYAIPNDKIILTIGGRSVPESGATVTLLGFALIGLAAVRRKNR